MLPRQDGDTTVKKSGFSAGPLYCPFIRTGLMALYCYGGGTVIILLIFVAGS